MSDIMRSTNKSLVEDFVMRNNGTEDSVFPEIFVDGESTFVLVVSEDDEVRVIDTGKPNPRTYAYALEAAQELEIDIQNKDEESDSDIPNEDDLNRDPDNGNYVQVYRRTVILEQFSVDKADTLFAKTEIEKVMQEMQSFGATPALLEKYYQLRAGTYNPNNDPAARAYDSPEFETDTAKIKEQVNALMSYTSYHLNDNQERVEQFREDFFSLFNSIGKSNAAGKSKALRKKFLTRYIDEAVVTNRDLHKLVSNMVTTFKIPANHVNALQARLSKAMYSAKDEGGEFTVGDLMVHLWNNYRKPQISD